MPAAVTSRSTITPSTDAVEGIVAGFFVRCGSLFGTLRRRTGGSSSTRSSRLAAAGPSWLAFFLAGIFAGGGRRTETTSAPASSSPSLVLVLDWLEFQVESLGIVQLYTAAVVFYLSVQVLLPQGAAVFDRFPLLRKPSKAAGESLPTAGELKEEEAAGEEKEEEEVDREDQPFDLSGAYRLVSNDGFEDFLAVQGVPWTLRSMAAKARPVHRITHRGRTLTIKIEGIIESQTTYVIGGPPVETNVRGRIFEDSVSYLHHQPALPPAREEEEEKENDNGNGGGSGSDGGDPVPGGGGHDVGNGGSEGSSNKAQAPSVRGIIVRKRAVSENYDVTVKRVLSDDGKVIEMTSTAHFRDEGKDPVVSNQVFHRCE